MADKMSTFAGALNQFGQLYPTDDMNAILYPVYGGFEDYVYAGSWKPDMTVQCTPDILHLKLHTMMLHSLHLIF